MSSVELDGVVFRLNTGMLGVLNPSLMANVFNALG